MLPQTKKPHNLCHYCSKLVLPGFFVKCCKKKCSKTFCVDCISHKFDLTFQLEAVRPDTWICYACGQKCDCVLCDPKGQKRVPTSLRLGGKLKSYYEKGRNLDQEEFRKRRPSKSLKFRSKKFEKERPIKTEEERDEVSEEGGKEKRDRGEEGQEQGRVKCEEGAVLEKNEGTEGLKLAEGGEKIEEERGRIEEAKEIERRGREDGGKRKYKRDLSKLENKYLNKKKSFERSKWE